MDKKIVFFDIDGTIWDYHGVIPNSTINGIKMLKENGHIPIICTGRAMGHVRDEKLLSLGFSGVVAACGAHVEYNDQMLYEQYLPDNLTKEVVELSLKHKVPVVLEGRYKHWVSSFGFSHDDFVHRMMQLLGEDAIIFKAYSPDMKINKFSGDIILASDYDGFASNFSDRLDLIYHKLGTDNGIIQAKLQDNPERVTGVFEAVTKGCSKAHGMKIICDYLGTDIKSTYAFGDSNNDLEMIECAGVGIAMGNGSCEIKKKADYVTDNLADDGLFKALKHFNLI